MKIATNNKQAKELLAKNVPAGMTFVFNDKDQWGDWGIVLRTDIPFGSVGWLVRLSDGYAVMPGSGVFNQPVTLCDLDGNPVDGLPAGAERVTYGDLSAGDVFHEPSDMEKGKDYALRIKTKQGFTNIYTSYSYLDDQSFKPHTPVIRCSNATLVLDGLEGGE